MSLPPKEPIARAMEYGNFAIMAHLLAELAQLEIVPEPVVFHVLQKAELWLLQQRTDVAAAGAGHVIATRQLFQEIKGAQA